MDAVSSKWDENLQGSKKILDNFSWAWNLKARSQNCFWSTFKWLNTPLHPFYIQHTHARPLYTLIHVNDMYVVQICYTYHVLTTLYNSSQSYTQHCNTLCVNELKSVAWYLVFLFILYISSHLLKWLKYQPVSMEFNISFNMTGWNFQDFLLYLFHPLFYSHKNNVDIIMYATWMMQSCKTCKRELWWVRSTISSFSLVSHLWQWPLMDV